MSLAAGIKTVLPHGSLLWDWLSAFYFGSIFGFPSPPPYFVVFFCVIFTFDLKRLAFFPFFLSLPFFWANLIPCRSCLCVRRPHFLWICCHLLSIPSSPSPCTSSLLSPPTHGISISGRRHFYIFSLCIRF